MVLTLLSCELLLISSLSKLTSVVYFYVVKSKLLSVKYLEKFPPSRLTL